MRLTTGEWSELVCTLVLTATGVFCVQSKQWCNCKTSSSSLIGGSGAGWEGTAVLHHGSYIKLGCVQFVFSLVDHASHDPVLGQQRVRVPVAGGTSLLKAQLRSPTHAAS